MRLFLRVRQIINTLSDGFSKVDVDFGCCTAKGECTDLFAGSQLKLGCVLFSGDDDTSAHEGSNRLQPGPVYVDGSHNTPPFVSEAILIPQSLHG